MVKYAYTRPDGRLAIVHAAPIEHLKDIFGPDWTEDEYRAHVQERCVPKGVQAVEITEADIPEDRLFRKAWKLVGKKITTDLPKAREVCRDKIRRERKPLLAALDVEFMKAVEADDKELMAELSAQKQKLRDATADPRIESASTEQALKDIIEGIK